MIHGQSTNPTASNHTVIDPSTSGSSSNYDYNSASASSSTSLKLLKQSASDGYSEFDHVGNDNRLKDGGQMSTSKFSMDNNRQEVDGWSNVFINIGPINSTHLTSDGNEIQCKSSTGANESLFLNYWGGSTYVGTGNNSGDFMIGNGADLFVNNSEGRIGINNCAPKNELHIKGTSSTADIRLEASGTKYLKFYEGTTSKGYIGHTGTNLSLHNNANQGNITMSTPNFIDLETNEATRMRIINNGDVGLGTTTPLSNLHIQDKGELAGIIVESVDANNYVNLISGSNGNSFLFAQAQRFSISPSSSVSSTSPISTNSVFFYGPNWSAPEQRGNMGVGYDSPVEKLDVNGRLRATGYVTPADKRLKSNVKDLEYGLEVVKNLRPVSFNFNGKSDIDDKSVHYGLIAQELKELAPEFVEKYTHIIY